MPWLLKTNDYYYIIIYLINTNYKMQIIKTTLLELANYSDQLKKEFWIDEYNQNNKIEISFWNGIQGDWLIIKEFINDRVKTQTITKWQRDLEIYTILIDFIISKDI